MNKEYNLRDRADIVVLAQQCAEELKAQPLIDYFENNINGKWNSYPEVRPEEYGKYEVYRAGCDKQHYLTWNGTGWSSDENTVTHFRKIIKPV